MTHATLIDAALAGSRPSLLRDTALALVATLLLTLSAKVQVPLIVPMTLQTLVVVVLGAAFGWRLGAATLVLYLAEGAMGLPVFAGTPERGLGLAYMMGPTGGYLVGFVVAAAFVGLLAARGWTRSIAGALMAMLAGHALIAGLGFAWLAGLIGAEKAFAAGVLPFLLGDVIKSALGAALLPGAWWLVARLRRA